MGTFHDDGTGKYRSNIVNEVGGVTKKRLKTRKTILVYV